MQHSHQLPSRKHLLFLLGCCMMTAVSVGICINAYGIFLTPVSNALGIGRGDISVHATLSALATGLLSPLAIKLMKRFHLKPLCVVGLIVSAGCTWLMSYAKTAWMFDVLGLIRGVSLACTSLTVITTAIGQWFFRARSTVTGIAMAFAGVSGAIGSPIITHLIESYGYNEAYRIVAVAMLVLALPTTILFITDRPEDIGLTPFGNTDSNANSKPSNCRVDFSPKSSLFLCLALLAFIAVAITSLTQHLSGYTVSLGWAPSIGAYMLSCVMMGNIISKVLIGILNDRMGVFASNILMMVVCLVGLFILLIAPANSFLLYIGAFLFGNIYSVSGVGLSNITYHLYGNEQYGRVYAIISMLTCTGSALSLSAIGYLYDLTGAYQVSILLSIAMIFICIVTIGYIIRYSKRKQSFSKSRQL